MRTLALFFLCLPGLAPAEEVLVAVATNFLSVADELRSEFETQSGHEVSIASGSSGKLYAQILNGGPFDIFMSADGALPERIGADLNSASRAVASRMPLAGWLCGVRMKT